MNQSQKIQLTLGIDFGTTNILISYWDESANINAPILLRDPSGKYVYPSWVSFSEEGKTKVGNEAKIDINKFAIVHDIKRIIGESYSDLEYEIDEKWTFTIENKNDNPIIKVYIGENEETTEFTPEEIAAIILRRAFNMIQFNFGTNFEIKNVFVSVPVKFNHFRKTAVQTACKLAGFDNCICVEEPTAAIMEYKRTHPNQFILNKVYKVLVIDFGGGTLDLSCCELNGTCVHIIKRDGDSKFGGLDFDKIMMDIIIEYVNKLIEAVAEDLEMKPFEYYKKPSLATGQTHRKKYQQKLSILKSEAERIKELLSSKTQAKVNLQHLFKGSDSPIIEQILDDEDYEIRISREEFTRKISKLVQKFETTILDFITGTNFHQDLIDNVIKIGGTCKIPAISNKITDMFHSRNTIISSDEEGVFDSFTAVCRGCCFYGYNYLSTGIRKTWDVEVKQTLPRNIGLDIGDGFFKSWFESGDVIPKRKVDFVSVPKGQKRAVFRIYEGNDRYVNSPGMEKIGSITIDNISRPNDVSFKVEMDIDENGLLKIDVQSEDDDLNGNIEIEINIDEIDEEYETMKNHIGIYFPLPFN